MAVGTMIARLIAVTGQFHREMDGAKKKLEKFEKTALAGSAAMAAGMAVATVAATAGGVAAVKLAAQWEQAEIAFTTLLGTAEEAKEFLVELDRFASVTPFELPGIMDASRKLLAFGWHAESVVPTMTAVGDAVAALGGGEAEIASVVRALGQMRAKGAVAAQEMTRQLAEVGIPAWDYLAKAIGTTVPEAMSLVERRAISASVGIKAILEGMTRSFGGAMEKQSRTMIGMWSTAKDEARAIGRGLGAYLAEAFNIKGVLGGFIAAMRGWANIIRGAETNAEGFREILRSTFPPSVRVAIVALAGAVGGTLIPVFLAAGKAIWAAALALAPFMLKGAAIAVTAYLIYRAWSSAGSGIAAVSVFMIRMAAAVVGVFGMLSPALRGVAARINAYADSVAAASVPAAAMAKAAEDAKKQQDNLAQSSMQAAAAQDALGKSTEDAAKQANGGIMAFDQVHRLQEQMAETAGAGLDAGVAGGKFVAPDIAMPEISFDLGPLAEMGKSWDRLKASMEAIQPVMEAVGYVISGVVVVKVGLLIAKLAALTAATFTAASTNALLWKMHTATTVSNVAVQIGAMGTLIAKWAALALAATVKAAKIAVAWVIALGPVAWVVAAVAGVAAAIIMNWDTILRATQQVWGAISSWVISTWQNISTQAAALWNGVALYFTTLWQGISSAAVSAWSTLAVSLSTTWRNLAALATTLWSGVASFLGGLWAGIGTAARGAWTGLSDWLVGLWGGIQSSAVDIWEGIGQAVVMPMMAVTGWLATTWETTRQDLGTVWGAISTTAVNSWSTLRTRAGDLWEGIRQAVVSPIERVRDWLANAWQTIRTTALNAFSSLRDGVLEVWNSIASGISGVVQRILSPINAIVEAVQNALAWLSRLAGTPTGGTTPRPAAPLTPLPPVPHLAAGGIVRKPTLAMIGEGRHDEAVIPLKRGMDMFGGEAAAQTIAAAVYQAIYDAMRVSRIEQQGESRQEVVIELDGVKLGRVLVPSIVREGRRTGRLVIAEV